MAHPASVARDPATPASVVAQLAADDRHEVCLAAAAHPACPAAALAALAERAERRWTPDDRIARLLELDLVARHPATDQSTVAGLAALDERIADELAGNVVRARPVAARVARHDDAEHRWGAAENPNLPADELLRLAADEDVYVRRAVLANPNIPLSAVEHLLRDPQMLVRRVAGSRDDLTDAMVAALLDDPEPDVQRSVRWFLARRALQ